MYYSLLAIIFQEKIIISIITLYFISIFIVLNNFLFVNIPEKGVMKFEISEITFNREEKEKILKEIEKQHIELSEIKDE